MRKACLLLFAACVVSRAQPPQFRIGDTSGTVHTSSEWSQAKAILLFFITVDCPIGNSYVPEMNRITVEYVSKGVKAFAVYSDTSDSDATVRQYAQDYRFAFPVLVDREQRLANLADATVTPQAVVLSPEGEVFYRGRIDNRVEDFGKQRPAATEFDLRNALDQVLAGQPVTTPRTKSVGCALTRHKPDKAE